jgi:hypothetical protein
MRKETRLIRIDKGLYDELCELRRSRWCKDKSFNDVLRGMFMFYHHYKLRLDDESSRRYL